MAGGPNRGWYPTRKANQPRPASIEHLERLNNAYDARLPGTGDQRKPLTLPTNITPNKYFGQSKHSSASSTREALRRVTSLLIKKGKRRRFALLEKEKKRKKEKLRAWHDRRTRRRRRLLADRARSPLASEISFTVSFSTFSLGAVLL